MKTPSGWGYPKWEITDPPRCPHGTPVCDECAKQQKEQA